MAILSKAKPLYQIKRDHEVKEKNITILATDAIENRNFLYGIVAPVIVGCLTGITLSFMFYSKIKLDNTIVLGLIIVPAFGYLIRTLIEQICHDTKIGIRAVKIYAGACFLGLLLIAIMLALKLYYILKGGNFGL